MGGFYHEDDGDSSPEIILSAGMDRGLAYAEACFETFRVVAGAVFCWSAHMARLQRGLAEFDLSLSDRDLAGIHAASLEAAAGYGDDALIRITVTGGESGWGLMAGGGRPAVYIQAMPAGQADTPLHLRLRSWPFPPKMRPAKFSADYADTLRALQGEPDVHVLFAHNGRLLGAATANLLFYRDGQWWTPTYGAGVLPGIVRAHLLATGLLRETECPPAHLSQCRAAAISNSGCFLRPVAGISGGEAGEPELDVKHAAFRMLAEAFDGMDGVPAVLPG